MTDRGFWILYVVLLVSFVLISVLVHFIKHDNQDATLSVDCKWHLSDPFIYNECSGNFYSLIEYEIEKETRSPGTITVGTDTYRAVPVDFP